MRNLKSIVSEAEYLSSIHDVMKDVRNGLLEETYLGKSSGIRLHRLYMIILEKIGSRKQSNYLDAEIKNRYKR